MVTSQRRTRTALSSDRKSTTTTRRRRNAPLTGSAPEPRPGVQREAGGRHAFPRDDVAGNRVGRVERAELGSAEAAVRGEPVAVDLEEVDDRAVCVDDADAVLDRRR